MSGGGVFIHTPLCLQLFSVKRNSFTDVNEQILKIRGLFRLAAHALDGATGVFGGFLTLKTEHDFPPFLMITL
jgi:hypothetical protein